MVDYLRVYSAGDVQPPAPPVLDVGRPAVPAGSSVGVKVTFRNESSRPASGTLRLAVPAPLEVTPAGGKAFEHLAPHQELTTEFTIRVPSGADGGSQVLRAVADLEGSAPAEAWTTLAVLGAVEPVKATGGRGDWVDLSWESLDPEQRVSYEVYASKTPGFEPGPATLVGTTRSATFRHARLNTDETWYYRVRATDGNGADGPLSSQTSAKTGPVVIIEAESLVPPTEATAPYMTQSNCCGVTWSDDRQVWFQPNGPGDRYTLTFDVPRAGTYDLTLVYTKAWDFGIHTQTLDGAPLGEAYDHSTPDGVSIDRQSYGGVSLSAGPHRLTFTVTGKVDTSPRYGFGLDAIELSPQ
jgi:hypothetical protein